MSNMNISGPGRTARKATEGAEKAKTSKEVMEGFKELVDQMKPPVEGAVSMEETQKLQDFLDVNKDFLKEKGVREDMLKFINDKLSGEGYWNGLEAIDALIEIDELKEGLKDSTEFRAIVGTLQRSWESDLESRDFAAIEKKFLEWETLAHIENKGLLPEAGFVAGFIVLLNKLFSSIAAFFGVTGYEVRDEEFRAMHPKRLETIEKHFLQENLEGEEKVYKDITNLYMLSRSGWIGEADAKKIVELLTKDELIDKLKWSRAESGYVIKTFLALAEGGKIGGDRVAKTIVDLVEKNKVPAEVQAAAMSVLENLINNKKVSKNVKDDIISLATKLSSPSITPPKNKDAYDIAYRIVVDEGRRVWFGKSD